MLSDRAKFYWFVLLVLLLGWGGSLASWSAIAALAPVAARPTTFCTLLAAASMACCDDFMREEGLLMMVLLRAAYG